MNTHRALNFMSTKGNQEASKSGPIKYAMIPGMLIYQTDTQKEMLSLSFQSKKDTNKGVSFFETIKTKH